MTTRGRFVRCVAPLGLMVMLLPSTLYAQSTASIAGVARDESGAVLPGVTVEASSPVLIEGVRAVVTNGVGQYEIVSLPPGVYSVTFTVPGFSVVTQEGITLRAGFTPTVNAELQIGSLEETITVTTATPAVDIRNVTQHRTVDQEAMKSVPATKHFATYASLIPGVKTGLTRIRLQDVGGSSGERVLTAVIHGSAAADMAMLFDGLRSSSILLSGGGWAGPWMANTGMIQEYSIDTSGTSAEHDVSGVWANPIPKSGGNVFSGDFVGNYSNDSLQSDNLRDKDRAFGLTEAVKNFKIYDFNPSVGGPIVQDKLWFYASYRWWGTERSLPGTFHSIDTTSPILNLDTTRPVHEPLEYFSTAARLQWQPAPDHGFTFYADHVPVNWLVNGAQAQRSFEQSSRHTAKTNSLLQLNYKYAVNNNLLIEFGESMRPEDWAYDRQPEVEDVFLLGTRDIRNGQRTRAGTNTTSYTTGHLRTYNGRAAVTYVTGSHTLKTGATWQHGYFNRTDRLVGDQYLLLDAGEPFGVTRRTTPTLARTEMHINLGLFVQEQWTRDRLTLHGGLRIDHVNAGIPEYTLPAKTFFPQEALIERQDNLPNFNDVSPRFGLAYDLFGDGRTALKWNMGRYVESIATNIADLVHPQQTTLSTETTHSWTDLNDDFFPQENELGPGSNKDFGTPVVPINIDPTAVNGWGKRGWNWETMVGIQHELTSGMSVDVSYHRRWRGNSRVTRNLAVDPASYDPFCVQGPSDSRLPGGGGREICGFYDISPDAFGLQDNQIKLDSEFGNLTDVYDGVDLLFNARLPQGILLQGGSTYGRAGATYVNAGDISGLGNYTGYKVNRCFVVNSPGEELNCDVNPPYQADFKLTAVYPFPFGVEAATTYQNIPGQEVQALWAAPASAVVGLGRPLSGGLTAVRNVPLIEPGTMYGDRIHQVDLRLGKIIQVGSAAGRIRANVDFYNLFNYGAATFELPNFGGGWRFPIFLMSGRIIKFGVSANF